MTLAFDSLQKKTIQEVLAWHTFLVEVLGREKTRVLGELRKNENPSDLRFFGMAPDEVEGFFGRHRNELDFVAMLDLMSAAEAAIRLDYLDRVDKRWKDAVSRQFRTIKKGLSKKNDNVSLEDHILDTWRDLAPEARGPVSGFKGALKLRHWLAHGRYWHPKLGRREYAPGDVFDICNDLLRAIAAWQG